MVKIPKGSASVLKANLEDQLVVLKAKHDYQVAMFDNVIQDIISKVTDQHDYKSILIRLCSGENSIEQGAIELTKLFKRINPSVRVNVGCLDRNNYSINLRDSKYKNIFSGSLYPPKRIFYFVVNHDEGYSIDRLIALDHQIATMTNIIDRIVFIENSILFDGVGYSIDITAEELETLAVKV